MLVTCMSLQKQLQEVHILEIQISLQKDTFRSRWIHACLCMKVSVSSVELDSSSRRGFRINVSMERSRPGLLVSVLEAFEELGLDVLDADVSCDDDTAFRLEALGSGQGQEGASVDEQVVRQAVLQAISKCMDDDDDE
uniref:Plant bHLH transcription factor ACT-like domain-containing protein n=1 Tax=Arundo donax TaxID=35708 RepID=A0A0A9E7Q3_ARUDO